MANDFNKQFNDLLKQLQDLGADPRELKAMRRAFQGAGDDIEAVNAELDRMNKRVRQLSTEAASASLSFGDLTRMIQENAAALETNSQFISKSARSQNKVLDISRDLLNDSRGITDLNKTDLQQRLQKLETLREEFALEKHTAREKIEALEKEKEQEGKLTKAKQNQLDKLNEILKYDEDLDSGLEGLIAKTRERLDLENSISANMGVAGALVEGTGALMQRLGMRSGIFHDAMKDAAQEMRDMAKDAGENVTFMNKLVIAAKGFSILAQGFGPALKDPSVIVGAIVNGFLDVNKAATETIQLTGQNAVFTQGLNDRLATTVQFLETAAELTKQTGLNAQNIFSSDVIAGAAELKNEMGLAADEAGGLAIIAQTTSGDIDQVTDSIVNTTSAFNKSNRSAVSQGLVLRDVAKTSDSIKASFSGMPDQLGKAAAAARRMGMDLNKVDQIAGSLLDFESSIEAELEAQLLTGNRINLAKARELALTNDLEGVSKEIFKNSVSINEFGRMNRIQQEAQAKALGLTRDELGKIAYNRAIELKMTEEQAAAAAGVRAEDMKRIAVQEKIQMLTGKLAQAFAPILEALVPIVDILGAMITPLAGAVGYVAQLIGSFLKFEPILLTIQGLIATIFGVKLIGGLMGAVKVVRGLVLATMASTTAKTANAAASAAQATANTALATSQTAVATTGTAAGGGLAAAGAGLGAFGAAAAPAIPVILAIGAGLLLASPAIYAFGLAIKSAFEGVAGIITAAGETLTNMLEVITVEKAAAMVVMGGGLLSLSAGLTAFSLSTIASLPAIGMLGAIALMGPGLMNASTAIKAMADGVAKLSEALATLETEKLQEVKDLVINNAETASSPVVAVTGAITNLIQGIAGTGDAGTDTETIKKLDAILAAIKEGGDVYLDSSKVGQALAMGSYKSS